MQFQTDPTNPPGPIQLKRITRLIGKIEWASKGTEEITDYGSSVITLIFSGEVTNPRALELLEAFDGRTLSKANA